MPSGPLFLTIDKDRERELLERLAPKPESGEAATVPRPSMGAVSAVPPTAQSPSPTADGTEASEIGYDDFAKVELRVGLVRAAERVPKKDKLLKLEVDLGEPSGPRTIVAGLALTFAPEQLVGRRVVVVANLAPRSFGKGLVSHGMLLASGPSEALHLATIGDDVAPGAQLK